MALSALVKAPEPIADRRSRRAPDVKGSDRAAARSVHVDGMGHYGGTLAQPLSPTRRSLDSRRLHCGEIR